MLTPWDFAAPHFVSVAVQPDDIDACTRMPAEFSATYVAT